MIRLTIAALIVGIGWPYAATMTAKWIASPGLGLDGLCHQLEDAGLGEVC